MQVPIMIHPLLDVVVKITKTLVEIQVTQFEEVETSRLIVCKANLCTICRKLLARLHLNGLDYNIRINRCYINYILILTPDDKNLANKVS